jgi:hypothetical protein
MPLVLRSLGYCCSQWSVWGSGLAGMVCAVAALATGRLQPWQIGFVASFVSKLSDTVSSEIGKVTPTLSFMWPSDHASLAHLAACVRYTREQLYRVLAKSSNNTILDDLYALNVAWTASLDERSQPSYLTEQTAPRMQSFHGLLLPRTGVWAHHVPHHNAAEGPPGYRGGHQCRGNSGRCRCSCVVLWHCHPCGTGSSCAELAARVSEHMSREGLSSVLTSLVQSC